jgi:tRNA-2-methylthio-N6-dimethylallyladenosine synthase
LKAADTRSAVDPARAAAAPDSTISADRFRRFFIETWGCQMNELDSQRLSGQLMQQGIIPTDVPGDADIILLNSCSVREKAVHKVYSRLGEYRLLKQQRAHLLIGLCGCVAQQEGERALRRMPDLDFVVGTARVGELREVIAQRLSGERVVAAGFPAERTFDFDVISREGSHKGMVTIIEGCNKKCTFCIVPTTRGPERSRGREEIMAEVRHLLARGFLEIELLGQTVNHWRDPAEPGYDFADLLDEIACLPDLPRLRFVTSYPRDFTDRMVEQIGRHANIAPYLHLPVQSGSDQVLRRMGRGYTRGEYLELLAKLRQARPGIAVSTDMIVGFPGETDDDFAATLDLVTVGRFSVIYAFTYSPRPGTAAPRLGGDVDPAVAAQRLQLLFDRQDEIQTELNQELEGQVLEVLVTGWAKLPGMFTGRTACHRVITFTAPQTPRLGRLVNVRVDRGLPHSLAGTLVS